MKRIAVTLLALATWLLGINAQTAFETGNQQYAAGNYTDAIQTYQSIINEAGGHLSKDYAFVYYNMGNAYFKQGELAQAILAYERALRLAPTNADIKYNLAFAQSRITDNIADTQAFAISNWSKAVRNWLTEQTWMWMSIVLFSLCLVCLLVFLLNRETWLRKTAFHLAWITLLVAILSCVNAGSLHQRDTKRAEAIITQGVVNAKSSPDRSGTDLFTLHEGTKAEIKETLGEWCNIRVGNNQGWVRRDYIERI
ncbi:MAG: tetratricopeptide repeat protein [Paludibacteraceae bacterium]